MATMNLFDMSDTWNAGGTTFVGIKLNATDTASAADSLLMDLQVGGSSKFKVSKAGAVSVQSGYFDATGVYGLIPNVGGLFLDVASTFVVRDVGSGYADLFRATSAGLSIGPNADTTLARDAAGTLAQRNGVNAQVFRLYNTYTDASNYERGKMEWDTNVLRIGTEKAGTGTARALELQTDGVTRLTLGTNSGNAAIGGSSSATGQGAFAAGQQATASGEYAIAMGDQATASGLNSFAAQNASSVSANFAVGFGRQTAANKISQFAVGTERFSANDIAQYSTLILSESTTNDTPKALTIRLYNTTAGETRATVAANTTWAFTAHVSGRSAAGTDNAYYIRQGIIKRDGSNNTALVGSVQTVGTDIESNASWDVAITADDTNECLLVTVTGVAATNIRWLAKIDLVEIGYP